MTVRDTSPGRPPAAAPRPSDADPRSRPRLRTSGDDMGSWILAAACRVAEPELFFPLNSSGSTMLSRVQIAAAKAVCHRCPVIESCRKWSLANPRMAEYGVWAGNTEEERRSERQRTKRATERLSPQER